METVKGQKYRRVSALVSWYTYGKVYEVLKVRQDGIGETIDDDGETGVINPNHFDRWELVE